MIPQRTQHELNQQAKNLIISIYEQKFGVNLYGVCPSKDLANREYYNAKLEALSVAHRYDDIELMEEIELNF